MYAAAEGIQAVVIELLAWGASINAKDVNGLTALHHAAIRGQMAVIRELISKGADLSATDNVSQSCIYL